ncbi:hypothetical protein Tco_1530780 [Tanacetum coccineum]
MSDITVDDVERIRKFFNVPNEIDEVVQTLIPEPIHTTPPNDDYVVPDTKSILDELLDEFRDEILNVTMVDDEADFIPTKDFEELERLLAKEPQSNFTEIQVDRDIISLRMFLLQGDEIQDLHGSFYVVKWLLKHSKLRRLLCCLSSSSVQCLGNDPYEAIRQAYLVRTDTESEPIEDPIKTEAPESPHTVASPTSLHDTTPPTCHVEESEGSDMSGARSTSSNSIAPLLPDHPLTHTTPTLVPILYRTARMAVRVPPAMSPGLSASVAEVAAMSDSAFRKRFMSSYESLPSSSPPDLPSQNHYREDEGHTTEDEDPAAGDEGLVVGDEGPGIGVESLRLGLGYGALRHWEIALGEGRMPSIFEVGRSSRSVPESEKPEIVSALRQPTLTTWMDLEDGIVYIDVPAYPPPVPPAQTPPSPEWSSASSATVETEGFLTELGARVEMQGGLIRDYTVQLEELSPALFERYDRDIRELFTRSGAVRDEIFSQRYHLAVEHKQERVAVTFGAIWRPVLALESWLGQTDAQRATLWHLISDTQGENQEL